MILPARLLRFTALVAIAWSGAAQAELPDPVKQMIEAAIATGDVKKVDTVVELAKQTNPDDAPEIDEIQKAFRDSQAELVRAEEARKVAELREAGIFDNWSGRGEIGGFQSSGNSDNVGASLALNLERKGIDWKHKIKANADYQRSNGRTSREQYLAAYEPRYTIGKRMFSYGLVQFERDRFQGIRSRYSASGGIGMQVIDTPKVDLAVKAGPAFRHSDYTDGTNEDSLGALAAFDFDWKLADQLTFTQDSNVVAESGSSATLFIDGGNTSLNLVTGLEAKVSNSLTTRLSYAVEYDSNPPTGAVSTDTLTRFSLVYGF